MEVREASFGNVLVLAAEGRIDHASADPFRDRLMPAVARVKGEELKLVLDLSGVEYMSSVGLRDLMIAAKQAKAQQGTIVVAGLKAVMKEIFEISRFNYVFKAYDDLGAALAAISATALAAFRSAKPG